MGQKPVRASRIAANRILTSFSSIMFVQYCIALARSRTDDAKAKNELTRIINDKDIDKGSDGVDFLTMAKIYLSRVLRRLGEDAEAQKQ